MPVRLLPIIKPSPVSTKLPIKLPASIVIARRTMSTCNLYFSTDQCEPCERIVYKMDFRYARRVYLSGDPYDPEQSINMEMTTEDKNEWQHPEELKFDRELNFGDFFCGEDTVVVTACHVWFLGSGELNTLNSFFPSNYLRIPLTGQSAAEMEKVNECTPGWT